MLAGAATLCDHGSTVIMRTTEEALLCVPDMYREGSFGLGAGKLRTIFKIVLPTAIPGILSGIILAIRTYRRRDSGTDLYGRNRCGGGGVMDWTNPCDSYVFAVKRDFIQMKHTQQQSFF